jgi:hypothetical protein
MWIYQGKPYEPTEETLLSYQGFVYEIEELDTGKKYIGKKFFWSSKILPITKTRKRKKRVKIQSDWKTYYGSNVELKENVIHKGEYRYKRTILRLCSTKGECSYYEAKLQFDNDVLLNDDYYNSFIGCKIHAKHLGK